MTSILLVPCRILTLFYFQCLVQELLNADLGDAVDGLVCSLLKFVEKLLGPLGKAVNDLLDKLLGSIAELQC